MPSIQRLTSQKIDNTEHDAGVKSVGVKIWDTDTVDWIKWDGTVDIDMSAEGISTAAKQDLLLAELEKKADLSETQPVSASSLPLPSGAATEATLAKTVGFDKNSNITASIVTVGSIKTITETDGIKTLTTTIDKTDTNNISITEVWS